MNVVGNSYEVRREQGFAVYVLANQEVEMAVVPELGARIITLRDLRTGRDWLWHPGGDQKLFRNFPGDPFERSPLVGVDECFPTITPCNWQGRELPDHGELWAAPWAVDREAWEVGTLRTSLQLKISPFDFSRTIELLGNEIRLYYQLTSRSVMKESYLWSLHPLLRLRLGDQLELPLSTRALLDGEPWLNNVTTASPAENCAKLFATPVTEGVAAIQNRETGDRLEFEWSPAENHALGIWLTRGGWHGHDHFALEPTNSDSDSLTLAAARNRCGNIAAGDSVTWQVRLRVGK
jgi:galactose mutarotase-like enzyme